MLRPDRRPVAHAFGVVPHTVGVDDGGAGLLRGLRYDQDNYFWADTYEGVNVVLLGKDVEGKSRLDLKDAKGFPLIRAILEAGRAGGGYVDYWFPRAGGGQALPKRAYAAAFEPFGWVVGTGNYVDDIDAAVAKARDEVHRLEAARRWTTLAAMLLVVGLAAAAAWVLAGTVTPHRSPSDLTVRSGTD